MANRKRSVEVKFRVTPEERAMIEQKCSNLELPTWEPICEKWHWTDMS